MTSELDHYVQSSADAIETRLVATNCAGPIVWPADLRGSDRILIADSAEFINLVLRIRGTQHPDAKKIRFVIVDRPDHRAFITRGVDDYLIVFTTTLLEQMRAILIHLTLVAPFMSAFGLRGVTYDFPSDRRDIGWVARLVTLDAPTPSQQQVRAGTELANLTLALLVNHEVAHAIGGHFNVKPSPVGSFNEADTPEEIEPDGAWAISQCLEVDADGRAIDFTLKDCLAGYYRPHWQTDEGVPEQPSVITSDPESVVRAVMFANLVLWAYLERDNIQVSKWEQSHPPLLFRCLIMTEVIDNVLVVLKELRQIGAPVVDVEASRSWYREVLQNFDDVMTALGSQVAQRVKGTFREQMDVHSARLQATWTTVRESLPAYRGRPALTAASFRLPP